MKHLKTYEKLNDVQGVELQYVKAGTGDYVIVKAKFQDIDMMNFINNSIGKIIQCDYDHIFKHFDYFVEYENIPENLQHRFNENSQRMFHKLKYWSSDKGDLQSILDAKKYGI